LNFIKQVYVLDHRAGKTWCQHCTESHSRSIFGIKSQKYIGYILLYV